ncbi:MAG: thiamine pyrophosphate-dependent enzyme [Planctomycetota bacterium]|jgi:pyruvate ferredoxin oxidoreductase beta subunit
MSNEKITMKNIPDDEFFYGHKGCPGCGGSLAVRLALKVIGRRSYTVLPAGCMAAVGFVYPQMAFSTNAILSTFPGTASMLSGITAGARSLGIEDYYAVGFAGDGGTADIGIQALSGAIDRNDRLIYICYDNEGYMNTGIQKSGLTPYGTRTTTTPAGTNLPGSVTHKKNLFEIIAAHGIEYAAVASIGYPLDYMNKVRKAKQCSGTSFIHVYASCPTGWGIPEKTSIEIAKEAVDCGLWVLAEYENGEFTLNRKPKTFTSVADHLKKQGRFQHLGGDEIQEIIRHRDQKWARIQQTWKC